MRKDSFEAIAVSHSLLIPERKTMSENPKTTELEHPITICLDFDGLCNTYDGWKGKDELFEPLPGLQGFLEQLKIMGYEIAVFSTRPAKKLNAWFHRHLLLHLVDGFPDKKPPAVMYVDDRGFRFSGDFDEVLEEIKAYGTEPWWHPDCVMDRPRHDATVQLQLDTDKSLEGWVVVDAANATEEEFKARLQIGLRDLEQKILEASKRFFEPSA